MSRASRESREKAAALLIHYFGLAGVMQNGDNRVEIREAVDHIVDAAVEEVKERMARDRFIETGEV